jgi:hypothetical protein
MVAAPASARERNHVRDARVLDNGAYVHWDFTVCTPRTAHFYFALEWRQAGRHHVYEGFHGEKQGRSCRGYQLGLRKRRFFLLGRRVRTRINVYLGADTIRSRWLTFTPRR